MYRRAAQAIVIGAAGDRARWIRGALIGSHFGLAVMLTLALSRLDTALWIRAILITLALLPLALMLPGLRRAQPSTLRWLALALVLYAGLGSVEVIATNSPAASGWFLFALIELGLAVMLNQHLAPRARGGREES
jgi:uncharacterized membrane protein